MIIQCDKCGTNYRFDEILIDGDGVWVRCTRCQNIFFLENPAREEIIYSEEAGKDEEVAAYETSDMKSDETAITFEDQPSVVDDTAVHEDSSTVDYEYSEETGKDEEVPAVETPDMKGDETAITFEDQSRVVDDTAVHEDRSFVDYEYLEGAGKDKEVAAAEMPDMKDDDMAITFEDQSRMVDDTAVHEDRSFMDYEESVVSDESLPKMPEFFEEAEEEKTPGISAETMPEEFPVLEEAEAAEHADVDAVKTSGKRTKVLALVFFILIIAFAVYLVLFPQFRQDLVDRIRAVVPLEESVVGSDTGGEQSTHRGAEIYFIDTREHAVNNWIVGDLLVVEGIAINKGDAPASKVKVRGKILDAAGKVLMEEMSYGGTVLTEEELRNLTKDELKNELSNPWGRDFDNRDIAKDGKLPFMIVFINPPENSQEYVIDLASVEVGTKN